MVKEGINPVLDFATNPICPATTRNPYIVLFGFVTVAGKTGLNTYYYKRKGSVLSTDELNSIFDGGDIYVTDTITGVSSRFLIQSYRFGGVSCFQKDIDIDNAYNTYVRETANDGVSWTDWKRTDNFGYNSLAELAAALKPLL